MNKVKNNTNINNKEDKKIIFEQDKYISKTLKYIDGELIFNKSIKKIKLNNSHNNKLFTRKFHKIVLKNEKTQRKEQKANIIIPMKKINKKKNDEYNNTDRDENFHLNKLSRIKRLSYLPKISPYIYNNNTSISIDYNKANEMGARGFRVLCNNESDSIKEILLAYNDYNYNNIYDYNTCVYFNNINDKLKNTTSKDGNNKINGNEKNNDFDGGTESKNIFDKNYMGIKKFSKINKLLKNKIERIKIQNKKVYKVLGNYKKKYFNNNADNRIYKLNYNAIEKHIPNTILNSKTNRILPENYTNKNNFRLTSYDNSKIKENKLFSNRLKNRKIRKSLSFNKICSNNSLNNSQNNFKIKKTDGTIYNLKKIFITNDINSPSNENEIYFNQGKSKEEITISNIFYLFR